MLAGGEGIRIPFAITREIKKIIIKIAIEVHRLSSPSIGSKAISEIAPPKIAKPIRNQKSMLRDLSALA